MDSIGLVLLAAGASTRMGAPKQLLPFRGKPLLQHVMDEVPEGVFDTAVLVLGAHASDIEKAIYPGFFQVKANEIWQEGIASSIRMGVHANLEVDHLMVLLADQPFVTEALIRQLVSTHLNGGHKITCCAYGGALGVPAVFSKEMFPSLLTLRGDRGAGALIRQTIEGRGSVVFEAGVWDVDTEGDYKEISR